VKRAPKQRRPVMLIRHAKAGERSAWSGDDVLRPLTAQGRRQSADLVGSLDGFEIDEIRSSPYRRCRETIAPLAAAFDIDVVVDNALAEGPADAARAYVRACFATAGTAAVVLCSHGDVIPAILDMLMIEDDLDIGPGVRSQKGSTWFLEADSRTGRAARALYLPPPTRLSGR
jgi:8-oxo-(d)GTP phosphatase